MNASPRTMTAALIAFVLATGGIFAVLFKATGSSVRLSQPYTVTAILPTAEQLSPTSNVRAAGVTVGAVKAVDVTGDGRAKVTFTLDDAIAPLSRDARLLVRTKTLLGENYLSIDPGSRRGGTIPDGGQVAVRQVDDAVQLDQILSVFDARTRKDLQANLRGMAGVVSGRGTDLNRSLGALAPTVADTGVVAGVLAAQRGDVHAVIGQTGRVLTSIGERRAQLQQLIRAGKRTADVVAARDRRLAQTVRTLPALLTQADATADRLGTFSTVAAPVVDHLTRAAVDLQPTVAGLEPAADSARRLFDRVPRLTKAIDPLLTRLGSAARAVAPVARNLEPLLAELNPGLKYLTPYAKEFGAFFANTGGANNEYDAEGAIIRVYPQFGLESLGLLSPDARRLYDRLLDVTGASSIVQLRTNHYPGPGTVGAPDAFDGKVPQLTSDP
jgi:phospholipid/cholesterol/gamma-HCH transport system substrate-binding protein